METQGNKLLNNVKTRWISMLKPTKRVMSEYRTLVVKMAFDSINNNSAKVNFELLCDIEVLYGLAILLPMLEEVNNLMKLAQARDIFVVDYMAAIKLCQADLYSHFADPYTTFKSDIFYSFKSLVDSWHDLLIMRWIPDLNTCMKHLAFDYNGQHIWANIWIS
jgi:hypothetical protein